jgi:hypothetical protein
LGQFWLASFEVTKAEMGFFRGKVEVGSYIGVVLEMTFCLGN